MNEKGVYTTKLKNGKPSYRASITVKGRHISLGSYKSEKAAHLAYLQAGRILKHAEKYPIDNLESIAAKSTLPYGKIVLLCNLRDNGLYLAAPIYIYKQIFHYYLSPAKHLTFDREDLFYYSAKRIMQRGGHLFVSDYGMQVSILSRYGVRPFAVKGRDYQFKNGDETDLRYANIEIINPYYGVLRQGTFGQYRYKAVLHLKGNFVIGTYDTPEKAAIAYNKAVDLCRSHGIEKAFFVNYIESVSPRDYAAFYASLPVSARFLAYLENTSK